MRKIQPHRLGIEQGDVLLFSDFQSDGPMWKGQGLRIARQPVTFSEPFIEPPAVRVWLTMWDIAHTSTSRIDIGTGDITAEGFSIVFHTWGDTRVARARAGWLAMGPLPDDDLWDVD
jgi:hypothetical protein